MGGKKRLTEWVKREIRTKRGRETAVCLFTSLSKPKVTGRGGSVEAGVTELHGFLHCILQSSSVSWVRRYNSGYLDAALSVGHVGHVIQIFFIFQHRIMMKMSATNRDLNL